MRAAFITEPGPPEAIRVGELPVPTAGPSDVLVQVDTVAVNQVDTYIRSGRYPVPMPHPSRSRRSFRSARPPGRTPWWNRDRRTAVSSWPCAR